MTGKIQQIDLIFCSDVQCLKSQTFSNSSAKNRNQNNDKYLVLKLQCFVCTPRLILRKKMLEKCSTAQSFIRTEMTTYRIGTLTSTTNPAQFGRMRSELAVLISRLIGNGSHDFNFLTGSKTNSLEVKDPCSAFFKHHLLSSASVN